MSKVAKATFGLMVATIIAKILGFGRELVLASSYGATMYSDAYITSMNIPTVIFASIGVTLGTVLIPMYMEVNEGYGEKKSLEFLNNVFNLVILLCLILSVLGLIFTKQIVKIFALGFNEETFKIAVNFTRVTLIGIVFTGLSYVMTAYLQIKNSFTIPGFTSVAKNIIIIISILLSIKYGPYVMIWGTLIGISSEFLFLVPFVINKGYRYKFIINLKDKYVSKMLLLTIPVFIGVAVNQVNALVDRTLASTLAEGSVSALNYANKLNTFVTVLFITSIGSVIYPKLAKLSIDNNKSIFIKSVTKSINCIIILVMPISVGAIVLANPIIKILFERGAFDSQATNLTAIALRMYSIGMISTGLIEILGKIFYSIQDTKTPMKNSAISMGINIILNFMMIKQLRLVGLALSTSISSIICMVLLFNSLKKRIGYFGQNEIIKTTLKCTISSIIMAILTKLTYYRLLQISITGLVGQILSLGGSVLVGIITYTTLITILKVEEITIITDMFKKKTAKVVS